MQLFFIFIGWIIFSIKQTFKQPIFIKTNARICGLNEEQENTLTSGKFEKKNHYAT